jgi:hypothetical protein
MPGPTSRVLGDTAGAIGDTKHSMLTLVQFQTLYGPGWILSNGASCVGSKYAAITGNSTVPDCRGYHLRGFNNGAGVNPDNTGLGASQTDQFLSHTHGPGTYATDNPGNHTHPIIVAYNTSPSNSSFVYNQDGNANGGGTSLATLTHGAEAGGSHSHSVNGGASSPAGGTNETRPKSVTVNIFIRIN